MARLAPMMQLKAHFEDKCGHPLVGGNVFAYESGTTTPKATFADAEGTTPNTHPIILDERGEAPIYLLSGRYRFIVKSRYGITIYDVNDIGDWFGTLSTDSVIEDGKTQREINDSSLHYVASIAELKTVKGHKNKQRLATLAYYAGSKFGGSVYEWDSLSEETDDGFTCVAVSGTLVGRWKLVVSNNTVDVTQAGAQAGLTSTDLINQESYFQKAIDYVSKIGGGTVTIPQGTYYSKVNMKANVHLKGTLASYVTTATMEDMAANWQTIINTVKVAHGTFLHSTNSTDLIYVGENVDNVTISDIEVKPLRFDQSTSMCGYGIRVAGKNFKAYRVKGEGFRFDPLYFRGKLGADGCYNHWVESCELGNSTRNATSLVSCHDITFKSCYFYQNDATKKWDYLFDIEPNDGTLDTVYNVTVDGCHFDAVTSQISGEPTLIAENLNTPQGRLNLKITNSAFTRTAGIRNNCATGWSDAFIQNCYFENRPFTGPNNNYVISGGMFSNNTVKSSVAFEYGTDFGQDFIIENNIFDGVTGFAPADTKSTWGLNTFIGGTIAIAPIDRRTITRQYREVLDIGSPASASLTAYSKTEVRQVNLTTTAVQVLTVPIRAGVEITICGADATDTTGSKAFIKLYIDTDNLVSVTAAQEIINDTTYGIAYSWSGRTLSLAAKTASANQFIVRTQTMAALSQYRSVTWLV
ncbi:hypothetical protein [Acinetobacter pittii]|uniref:hypothetical protein n=1 Tax=Acinetobacter pittii TaxID=48296 RepID=UPI001D097C70|nr:hypothetical protein [Acinetobacter pittii]